MKLSNILKRSVLVTMVSIASPCFALAEPQVLATIGKLAVTSDDLEMALASSPFATQFPSMNENDQAALRGGLLQRLVASRLLALEAKRLELDQSPAFTQELESFRLGLLYRHYMDKLRERVAVPEDVLAQMKDQFKGDADALAGAKSAYVSDRYRGLRFHTVQTLRDKYHVKLHEDRIVPGSMSNDAVLLEGDGVAISYGDLVKSQESAPSNPEWIKDQLYKRAELLLVAKAAEAEGVGVGDRLDSYAAERLPALLVEQKQREWTSDEKTLREFFDANPQIGRLEERRHIGQLVTATREEADSLRKRILAGESLFELASQYSIDPYGKAHKGDMGWVREGSGPPPVEAALKGLEDGKVSEVVQSPLGFHLVTILERRPGGQKTYAGVSDRVRQLLITERMASYMSELAKRYEVVWNVVEKPAANQADKPAASK